MAYDFSRVDKFPINAPLALVAGGAVAFVMFAMPQDIFTQLIGSTGLPSVVPAAEPPLGNTARAAVAGTAAIAACLTVWALLTAFDRQQKPRAREEAGSATDILAPRLRRADAHPDAPPRPPIFAGRDFGFPAEDEESELEPLLLDLPDEGIEEERAREALPFGTAPETAEKSSVSFYDAADERQSISHLLQRLELGLLRREHHVPLAEAPEPAPTHEAHEPFDNRLRSAIQDLQKLASRSR